MNTRLPPGAKLADLCTPNEHVVLNDGRRADNVDEAWKAWELASGVSRLQLEAFEDAVEFVRQHDFDDGNGTQHEVRDILAKYEGRAGEPSFFKDDGYFWWFDNLCVDAMGPFESRSMARADYKSCRPAGADTTYR